MTPGLNDFDIPNIDDVHDSEETYPAKIALFHAALARVPGVRDVSSSIEHLEDVAAADLSQVPCAHLPIGALRRTEGGLPGEALVQVEFTLTPDAQGWRALEFLAWWTRDAARGDESIQLRPDALPPRVGAQVQIGQTLRLYLEVFFHDTYDLAPILEKMVELVRFLDLTLNLYEAELKD